MDVVSERRDFRLKDALDRKEHPCCVFLDFAKAFDTIDHQVLISKLDYYGIRGNVLDWMRSYLENRQQCVQVGNCQSKFETVEYGVPQGSILGPVLFLLYINDISKSSDILDFHLFADDTSLFHSHTNLSELQSSFNNELNKVAEWLKANKLCLNVK